MTASGQRVLLAKPEFQPTPVHTEKITHPGADSMGTVTAAHAPWPKSSHAVPRAATPQLPGIDVSSYQGNINWASVAPSIDFVYAKGTEGTYYTNPDFDNQYTGPHDYGVIRGAYHFAIPGNSQGQAQADYFVSNGGGWSGDGLTLPGALDIEYNPYGSECYGLTQAQMVTWISNFVNEYAYLEGVYPVIYSTTDWWTTCTGNSASFAAYDPLWIANYSASAGGTLPSGWAYYTFWQYADSGSLPGDQDVFNGAYSQLQALAANG
jgi:GH25 family lysozyme M1 (1,4-beta-N-acetylmuramidase)